MATQVVLPDMPYLSERGLLGLKNYQYLSGGYTWLDDVHQPFWNWIVNYFPMWLAPNLITLLGTMGLLVGYVCSAYHLPEFSGCDALSVHLITAQMAGTLSLGSGPLVVIGTLAIMIPWMAAQWEEYHTGLMLYGNGYWGVTEANYLLIVINWLTAAVGPWLWASKVREVLHLTPPSWLHPRLAEATVNEAVVAFVVTFGLEQLSGQVYRVFKLTRYMLPVDGRGHKKLGRRVAASHLLQFTLMFGLGAVVTSQHMTAPGQLRAVFACFGIIYALQATRLIMCHMCKEPFEIFWWPITLLVACTANSYLQVLDAALVAWAAAGIALASYLHYVFSATRITSNLFVSQVLDPALVAWAAVGITLAGYLHYVFSVINQICGFLGISCLTIPVHDPVTEEKKAE